MVPEERIWATKTRRLRKQMRRIVERDRQSLGTQFNAARIRIDQQAQKI